MVDPAAVDDVEAAHTVLDFWERAARGFRGDGTRQAWDSGTAAVYDEAVVAQLLDGAAPIADDDRLRITRFNATLIAYLFLLYFDTRVGAGDTGPYPLADGRVLLVRDYYQLADSDFWWSDVAAAVPYRNLTAALVLDGVRIDRITDFGTTYTTPESYLDHLVGFGLFTTDGQPPGGLRPVPLSELDAIVAAVRPAQSALYRSVAGMDRHEKIRCGAYVYFSFLRPYAAGGRPGRRGLDRAEGHPRPALRAGLGHGGRQRRRGGRRPVLRPAGVTSPWAAADELRHADAGRRGVDVLVLDRRRLGRRSRPPAPAARRPDVLVLGRARCAPASRCST